MRQNCELAPQRAPVRKQQTQSHTRHMAAYGTRRTMGSMQSSSLPQPPETTTIIDNSAITTMKGSVLQSTAEFRIIQFIIHAHAGPLGATVVRHSCSQPAFRARIAGIVQDATTEDFYRFEKLDKGELGDRLGFRKGDIYLVYGADGWRLGTDVDLRRDMSSGKDFAMNVLRDLLPSTYDEQDDCVNDHDDLMEEEETSTEKTEESISQIDGVKSKTTIRQGTTSTSDKFPGARTSAEHVEKGEDDDDQGGDSSKVIEADIPGYRILEYVVRDHFKKPFETDYVEHQCSKQLRRLLSGFLDSSESFDTFFQFHSLPTSGIPYGAGIREHDILLRSFKGKWFLGEQSQVEHKLKSKRNFLVHVLRKDSIVSMTEGAAAMQSKSDEPEIIDLQSSGHHKGKKGRRRSSRLGNNSPTNKVNGTKKSPYAKIESPNKGRTSRGKISKTEADSRKGQNVTKSTHPPLVLQVAGYQIFKGHVQDNKSPFGAELKEEQCPGDFLKDLRGFFPEGSIRRSRFVKVQKGRKADQIGIRAGDIFLHHFKNEWFLGTPDDYKGKVKKNRGFFIFFMRKEEFKNSPTVASEGSGKVSASVMQSTPSAASKSGKRRRDESSRTGSTNDRLERRKAPRKSHVPSTTIDQKSSEEDSDEESAENSPGSVGMQPTGSASKTQKESKYEETSTKMNDDSEKGDGAPAMNIGKRGDDSSNLDDALMADEPDGSIDHTGHSLGDSSLTNPPPNRSSAQTLQEDDPFPKLNLADLSKRIAQLERADENMELLRHVESLLNPSDLEKFVCLGGLCHAFGLLKHPDEDIQVAGWQIVIAAHSHMPQCHSSLADLGVYRRICQSLQDCRTKQLFEILVDVLVSPILGTDAWIQDFASLDGAVPSVIMAIDRQLGSKASYISCCRFLANVIASRR